MSEVRPLGPSYRLWREHSDRVYGDWLERRLAGSVGKRLLKTDAFDEAMTPGPCAGLARSGWSVVAVDSAAGVVREAAALLAKGALAVGDVRALPFADDCFDAVVSLSTLDHFGRASEIADSLREIARVLRPGGRLLLTLDNPANPAVALRNALPERWLRRTGIVPYALGRTIGPEALVSAVEASGFEVLDTTAILHCPRVIAVAMARVLQSTGAARSRGWFIRSVAAFERLESFSSRYRTGYFTAVDARRSGSFEKASAGR